MPRVRRSAAVCIFTLGLLGAALAGAGGEPQPNAAAAAGPAAEEVDCETRLQVVPGREPVSLNGRRYIGAGPVSFSAWFRDQARDQLRPRPGRTKLIKAPLFVAAGPTVTVSIRGRSARRAEFEIPREPRGRATGPVVLLTPCGPDATVAGRRVGRHTPFIGGYRIDGPMCMRVQVLPDGGEPVRKRLPFGKGSCRR